MDFEEVEVTDIVRAIPITVLVHCSIKGHERSKENLKDKVFKTLAPVRRSAVRKLMNLPIFQEVHQKLINCEPIPEVVRFIHDEGFFKRYSAKSLKVVVDDYRATIPKAHFLAVNVGHKSNMLDRAQRYMHDQIDILREVEELAKYSLERISRLKAADKAMNLPIPMEGFGKEINIFMNLAKYLQELREKSGLDANSKWPEQDQQVIDIGKAYDDPKISETIRNPASRYKILKVMEKIERMSSRDLPSEKDLLSYQDKAPVVDAPEQVEDIDLSLIERRSSEAED